MIDGKGTPELDLSRLKVISALGRGAKGVVFLVQNKENNELFALKAICKEMIERKMKGGDDSDGYRRIFFEKDVLRRFDHPLLPRLKGTVSAEKVVGYTIDYCPGRDLNSLRKKQTENMFSDDIIRFYAAELVLSLEYLHGLGIVYRDLKPENIMIQETGHLMLVDFDLSKKLSPISPKKAQATPLPTPSQKIKKKLKKNRSSFAHRFCNSGITPEEDYQMPTHRVDSVEKSNSFVGTEEYVAPEIISGHGHEFSVDWWCLGVVLYEMLYGVTPFRGINRKETFYRILTKTPGLVGEATPLRDLIRKLLEKDPKARIGLEEIKGHDFFSGIDWDSIVQLARPPYIPVEEEGLSENKEIDVESFVQNVFKIGNEEKVKTNDKDLERKTKQDFVNCSGTNDGHSPNLSPNEFSNVF